MNEEDRRDHIRNSIDANKMKLLEAVGMTGFRIENAVAVVSYKEMGEDGEEFLGIIGLPDQPDWISQALAERFTRQFGAFTINPAALLNWEVDPPDDDDEESVG